MQYLILYNPKAGEGKGQREAKALAARLEGQPRLVDITQLPDAAGYVRSLAPDLHVILCGGDGTLSRFANELSSTEGLPPLYYYATGSGNDFWHDLGLEEGAAPIRIEQHLRQLPVIEVQGQRRKFINGVGYGVDGYVCEQGAILREKTGKPIDYTRLAIRCLLFGYQPAHATVTADGVTRRYKKVWLAPAMKGRFFGGGMMIAPAQQRAQQGVSVVVVHSLWRLRLLSLFPSIFKGAHVKYTNAVDIFHANRVEIAFDRPTAMQIDGEVLSGVERYVVEG